MKVLCSNSSLFCELSEGGLYIHVTGDVDPDEVEDYLDGCDCKKYSLPLDESTIVGFFVYPLFALFAMQSLVDRYDLIIQ